MINNPLAKTNNFVSVSLAEELDNAKKFLLHQHAPSTLRAYKSDWAIFGKWCAQRGVQQLPAQPPVIAVFLSSQAAKGIKASTLARRVAAIRYFHAIGGVNETPTTAEVVRATMKGIRRSIGAAKEQKAPVTADLLLKMIDHVPKNLQGLRDRAILLLGFAGAFRRSELSALQVADLEYSVKGLRVHIRKSKTDQEGEGQVIPVLKGKIACPVEAVSCWLREAGINAGPVFRRLGKGGRIFGEALSPHSVGQTVKKYAKMAGFPSEEFSGHSLRSGFLTSAAMNGASVFKMMEVSRHKSIETLRGYVRQAEEFQDHAGQGLL